MSGWISVKYQDGKRIGHTVNEQGVESTSNISIKDTGTTGRTTSEDGERNNSVLVTAKKKNHEHCFVQKRIETDGA